MNKLLPIVLIFFVHCSTASAFVFSPPITQCASTDGGRWYGQNGSNCGTSFFQGDSVAYQFSLEEYTPIYSLSGWISYRDVDINTFAGSKIVIYDSTSYSDHTGYFPAGEKLFSESFSFDVDPHSSLAAEWRGVSDININLQPGTYWASFEDGVRGTFVSGESGIKIATTHTPEPVTMLTLGAGALFAVLRRKKLA